MQFASKSCSQHPRNLVFYRSTNEVSEKEELNVGKRRRVGGKCTRREKSRSRSESQTKQGRFYKCSAKLLVIDVLISLVQAAWGCPIIYCVGALQRKLATFFPSFLPYFGKFEVCGQDAFKLKQPLQPTVDTSVKRSTEEISALPLYFFSSCYSCCQLLERRRSNFD